MDDRELLRGWRLDGQRRALQPSSLRRREDDLRCFARWWGKGLLTADGDAIQQFLDTRTWRGEPIVARSRYKWASTIATFYRWCLHEGYVEKDPTLRIIRPRLRRLLPRPWLAEDMEVAVEAADPTMRCWILLAAYAGCRCLEIAALDRDDVLETWHPKILVLHGKGGVDRTVPLHPRIEQALIELPMPRRGRVFTRDGAGYSAAQVSWTISAFFRDLGMPWTAHQGRHFFGTKALEASGGDLRLVQELLGHASITSTTIYTQWSQVKAAQVVNSLA